MTGVAEESKTVSRCPKSAMSLAPRSWSTRKRAKRGVKSGRQPRTDRGRNRCKRVPQRWYLSKVRNVLFRTKPRAHYITPQCDGHHVSVRLSPRRAGQPLGAGSILSHREHEERSYRLDCSAEGLCPSCAWADLMTSRIRWLTCGRAAVASGVRLELKPKFLPVTEIRTACGQRR